MSLAPHDEPGVLDQLSRAYHELAEAATADEALSVVRRAKTVEDYARRIRESTASTNRVVALRLRAERRTGQLIPAEFPNHRPGKASTALRLSDVGISYEVSRRYQQVAAIPDEAFEQMLAALLEPDEDGEYRELSRAALVSACQAFKTPNDDETPDLTPDEQRLRELCESGQTVVVNQHRHAGLIQWARNTDQYEQIDRSSPWGNPFILGADGDRAEVVDKYARFYLPNKPSLLDRICDLRGRVLGCWCAPEACHGDILAEYSMGCEC